MKVCVQRVIEASVTIDGDIFSSINQGLLIFLGIEKGDNDSDIPWLASKVVNLRIFTDNGKMTNSVIDIGAEVLVVSQFTLAGNCDKGRRPDFTSAEVPSVANEMYEKFISELGKLMPIDNVKAGVFGADMKVSLVNDGPVTLIIEK